MTIMIIFNVLVVRAVDEANKRRARMTRRQQRNITVTSMLVTVVLVKGHQCFPLLTRVLCLSYPWIFI